MKVVHIVKITKKKFYKILFKDFLIYMLENKNIKSMLKIYVLVTIIKKKNNNKKYYNGIT